MPPGQSRFYVSTMGMPGQEQVISVAREEYYAEGKQPTLEGLTQALIAKYGQPSDVNDAGTVVQMWSAHSLAVTSQNGAWGYELLQRTEGVLKAADASKKAKEVEDASKNAGAPKL